MPRFTRELLDVCRRWSIGGDRSVNIKIEFRGPSILGPSRQKFSIFAFDHDFGVGFSPQKASDFLTASQMAQKARKEALKRLARLERRVA